MSTCPRCGTSTRIKSSQSNSSKTKLTAIIVSSVAAIAVIAMLFTGLIPFGVQKSSSSQSGATSPSIPITTVSNPPDSKVDSLHQLREYALQKINADRAKSGLSPVALSNNGAAQAHAQDILKNRKLSHWTTDGMKPYMRYTVYNGTGDVAQNAAISLTEQGTVVDSGFLDPCNIGICKIDVKKEIDQAEFNMMYNDSESQWGHRDNILDKHHTHVSIGIAYNDQDFAFVQNFENQYIDWSTPIRYDTNTNFVSMQGRLNQTLHLEEISVYYDPTPTHQTYLDNYDKHSYDSGEDVALVVPPSPTGYVYNPNDSSILIQANQWSVSDNGLFAISFDLTGAIKLHGSGVYTLVIWAKNGTGDEVTLTSHSLFRG